LTPVTKIFVVLVCLFAFIFTPLAISFVARSHNWKALADQYDNAARTALANERAALGTAASLESYYQRLRDQDSLRVHDMEKQIADLEQKIEQLTREKEGLEASRASWESSAQTLTAQIAVTNSVDKSLREDNKRLSASELDLRTRNDSLQSRVQELSANAVTLAQQLRQKIEELTAVRQENDQLRKSLHLGQASEALTSTPTPTAKATTPTPHGEIRGTVTQVKANQGLASIDVGSSAGVTEGMVMAVIRDSEYICDLVITDKIDPTQSVGKITAEGARQIRPGDTVIDEQSLMAR
jgi:TolA-binding protein